GIFAAFLFARFPAGQLSRWAGPDVTRPPTGVLFWVLPRGLVTAVLALEIVDARGGVFAFLPAVAFTVVLVTNLFIVWGAVKSGRTAAVEELPQGKTFVMEELKAPESDVTTPGPLPQAEP